MNEQECATLLKQKILEINKIIEEMEKDEEFINFITENMELLEQVISKKINPIFENITDSQMKDFLLILTESFIEKNEFDKRDISFFVEHFLETLDDENFDFRNQLLNNKEFMNAIKGNCNNIIVLFNNSTDEKAILDFLNQYVKDAKKIQDSPYKSDFSRVYENVLSLQTISKENKKNLLLDDDYLNYVDHKSLTEILSTAIFYGNRLKIVHFLCKVIYKT